MSTLKFPYPRTWKTTVRYTLERVDGGTSVGDLLLDDVELHHEGHNSATYFGNLLRGEEHVASVVCKVAFTKKNLKRLRHEASLYEGPLKELQNEGEMEDEELTGCLITQYNGQHRKEPLNGMSWDMRWDVISALMDIHDVGVGDFAKRNVVFTKEGAPCIIDFGHATAGHKCERKMDIVIHAPRPDKEDFGCDELYEACRSLNLWTPPYITYLYQYCPVECSEDAEILASFAPEDMPREEALSEARAAIFDFAKAWNKRMRCEWWH